MKHPLNTELQESTTCRTSDQAEDGVLDHLLQLTARGYPCRPDLLPQSHLDGLGQAVLTSNIIFGRLPGNNWMLVYSRIGRRDLTWQEVYNLDIPANALFLVVDCRDGAELDNLRQYASEIKLGRRPSDA